MKPINEVRGTVLFFLTILFVYNHVQGQSFSFKNYQVENGLSYNSVLCSIQDKKGFMWFGTKSGLNRFDGYSFRVYQTNQENKNLISDNIIYSLYEDKNEILWVGTHNGLYTFDPAIEKFTVVPGTRSHIVRHVVGDSSSNVWFVANGVLSFYNNATKEVKYFNKEAPDATSIGLVNQDKVWFSTATGYVKSLDLRNNLTEGFNVSTHLSADATDFFIEKLYYTGHNSFLVSTVAEGVKLFDIKERSYKDILARDDKDAVIHARDMLYVGDETYWFGTESGVFIYDFKNGTYKRLRHHFNDPYSLSDNAVYTLMEDREGGIWVGTYFGGLNYYPKQYNSFYNFFTKGEPYELQGRAVREIVEDKYENLWVGTEDEGLNRLDPKTNIFNQFTSGNGVKYTNIHGLLADDDWLWVGTFQDGISVLDLRTERVIKRYISGKDSNSIKNNFVESFYKTKAGEIFVGTGTGLYRYNKAKDNFSLIRDVPETLHYVAIIEDANGSIWAGSLRDGLYYFNPSNHSKGSYISDPNNSHSLSSNSVNSLFIDSRKNLWVATEGGLCKYNPKDQQFDVFSQKDGFLSNIFYKVQEDQYTNLWISTGNGLAKFNQTNGKIENYTKSDGLLTNQFNYNSAFTSKEGQMYFGSVKGLLRFDPASFSKSKFTPPVYITGIQVDNNELLVNDKNSPLERSVSYTKEIKLGYKQSTFSIDFAALSYTAPENVQYAYMMEGLDNNWIYLKANRKVYFTNLAPGDYVFKVKASNSSGVWNENIAKLNILIAPPFWASKTAYVLYILVALGLITLFIREYSTRVHRKNKERLRELEMQKEKELYKAKIEFFTYVTHEIRTPLTLIKAPLEDILSEADTAPDLKQNLLSIEKNTNRLLDLTNQLLDFRKTESKGFSLTFVQADISKLLVEIYNRFKSAIDQRKLNASLDIPEVSIIAYADPEALNKIISNLLDNGVKYAKGRIGVRLSVDRTSQTFLIEVKNDGNLIPESDREKIFEPFYRLETDVNKRGTGIGLPLARSLTELHEGKLLVEADQNQMNVFRIILPFMHEHTFDLGPKEAGDDYFETSESVVAEKDIDLPVILIVEDNAEILDFIEHKLTPNYLLLKASNGKEAIEVLRENAVHLIISDIMMPVMDGLELCRYVKTNVEFTHIPIILLTAKNTVQSKIEGLETGADAYIEKPFSLHHLRSQISNLLANREKIKNYFASSPLVHIKSIAYNKADEAFLEELNEAIHKNLSNPLFDVDILADAMNMSRATLYRKIKAISNLSPRHLIAITRLKKAAELLVESDHKISTIARMVGFSSQSQLSRSFIKQFGMTPSEYASSKKVNTDKAVE